MLRFADEEDNEELVCFVNITHLCECCEESPFVYKKKGASRITLEEIEKDLDDSSLQWIILEVYNPTDMIIGAARYYTSVDDENERKGIIDIFAIAGKNDNKYYIDKAISNQLLNRIEHMTIEQGINALEIHVPQWRDDLMELLIDCGYTDQGGLMCTSSDNLLKPTMIIHMRKRIFTETTNDISNLLDMEIVENGTGTNEMELLMSTLFDALRKEHGDNKGFENF
jgi:hypothetical protein